MNLGFKNSPQEIIITKWKWVEGAAYSHDRRVCFFFCGFSTRVLT